MLNTTSYRPVEKQFSLKAFIFNRLQAEKFRPVTDQATTSKKIHLRPVGGQFRPVETGMKGAEASICNQPVSAAPEPEAMPLCLVDGFKVPDYAVFCSDWWKGCFTCSEYMAGKVRFCRKWNRIFGEKDFTPDTLPELWPVMAELNDRYGCSCLTSEQMDAGSGAVVLAWDERPEDNTRRAALAFARKHWRALLQDMALSAAKYRNCRTWCGNEGRF